MFQGQPMMQSPYQLPAMAQIPQAIAAPLGVQAITPPAQAQAHGPAAGVAMPQTRSASQQAGGKKIPRPSNAWIMYRKHHHASAVAANQGLSNNEICESSNS
jgi:hypothetical protein